MSMVLLAMLFMLEQRLQHQPDIPLLSCPDVATLLKSVLPRKDLSIVRSKRSNLPEKMDSEKVAHL
jgi:hypothetical protein